MIKKIIAFDVDSTLSLSRSPVDSEMAELLKELLQIKKVAIITGGAFSDIKRQILDKIGENEARNKNLILLPTNGGGLWVFNEKWTELSSHKLKPEEKEEIIKVIKEVLGLDCCENKNDGYGDKIQDRNSEITYSALGEHAPLEEKKDWDPDLKKRVSLQKILMDKLPNLKLKSVELPPLILPLKVWIKLTV